FRLRVRGGAVSPEEDDVGDMDGHQDQGQTGDAAQVEREDLVLDPGIDRPYALPAGEGSDHPSRSPAYVHGGVAVIAATDREPMARPTAPSPRRRVRTISPAPPSSRSRSRSGSRRPIVRGQPEEFVADPVGVADEGARVGEDLFADPVEFEAGLGELLL